MCIEEERRRRLTAIEMGTADARGMSISREIGRRPRRRGARLRAAMDVTEFASGKVDGRRVGVPPYADYSWLSASESTSNPDTDIIFSHPSIFVSVFES